MRGKEGLGFGEVWVFSYKVGNCWKFGFLNFYSIYLIPFY